MNYATIKKNDIANGPGVRVSLFVSGCRHRCPGCFNREAWDFNYGAPFTRDVENDIIAAAKPSYVTGLTLLGGEPFEPENQAPLVSFVKRFREENPTKTVWCYTGFLFEDIIAGKVGDPVTAAELLSLIDTLVDGRFVAELKDLSLMFRGSSNQRILDVCRSKKEGKAVIMDGTWERRMGSGNIEDSI